MLDPLEYDVTKHPIPSTKHISDCVWIIHVSNNLYCSISFITAYMFLIYRYDRVGGPRGGTCAFVSKTLKSKQVILNHKLESLLINMQCELICFHISVKLVSYKFILLYLPPNSRLNKNVFHLHIASLNCILTDLINPNETTILTGDFNLPNINWLNNIFPIDGTHDLWTRFPPWDYISL